MAKVLVVDDDAAIRSILERVLVRGGHEAVVAPGGREALDLLPGGDFDLIITDVNMPAMDGIELILALQEVAEGLPIIAISGGGLVSAESLLQDAKALGAVDIVSKPFESEELLDLIEKHVS